MSQRMFPIQSSCGAAPHPTQIPWHIADLAYSVYRANYGSSQSLERLAERGGFGPGEMDMFLPGWREMCSDRKAIEEAKEIIEGTMEELDPDKERDGWFAVRLTKIAEALSDRPE